MIGLNVNNPSGATFGTSLPLGDSNQNINRPRELSAPQKVSPLRTRTPPDDVSSVVLCCAVAIACMVIHCSFLRRLSLRARFNRFDKKQAKQTKDNKRRKFNHFSKNQFACARAVALEFRVLVGCAIFKRLKH